MATKNEKTLNKSKVGRKKLPIANKRRMYSTRLHPKVIDALNALKSKRGEPASRLIEILITKKRMKSGKRRF